MKEGIHLSEREVNSPFEGMVCEILYNINKLALAFFE